MLEQEALTSTRGWPRCEGLGCVGRREGLVPPSGVPGVPREVNGPHSRPVAALHRGAATEQSHDTNSMGITPSCLPQVMLPCYGGGAATGQLRCLVCVMTSGVSGDVTTVWCGATPCRPVSRVNVQEIKLNVQQRSEGM